MAREPWHVVYENGVSAVRRGDWSTAESLLKQALENGPPQSRNLRLYGLTFIDYIPSFHLAEVYFNQGRYIEAQEQLRHVQSLGLVKKGDREFDDMTKLIEKLSDAARGSPPRAEVSTTSSSPVANGQGVGAPIAAQRQKATATVDQAIRLLADGDVEGSRKAFESARSIDPDNPALEDLAERIARSTGQIQTNEGGSRNAETDGLVAEAKSLWLAGRYQEVKRIGERGRSLGLSSPQLDELVDRADFAEEVTNLSRLVRDERWELARNKATQLIERNDQSSDLLRLRRRIEAHFASAPTESLRAGVQAFYAGEYQKAASMLEKESQSRPNSAEALFYLACSEVALALWQDSGEKQKLLTEARDRFDESRRINPEFKFERQWISPRILRELTDGR